MLKENVPASTLVQDPRYAQQSATRRRDSWRACTISVLSARRWTRGLMLVVLALYQQRAQRHAPWTG